MIFATVGCFFAVKLMKFSIFIEGVLCFLSITHLWSYLCLSVSDSEFLLLLTVPVLFSILSYASHPSLTHIYLFIHSTIFCISHEHLPFPSLVLTDISFSQINWLTLVHTPLIYYKFIDTPFLSLKTSFPLLPLCFSVILCSC